MTWNETVGMVFIGIGVAFDALGCFGMVRLPDLYNRLQAATKCVTFGTCGIFMGIFFMKGFTDLGIKSLVGIVFVLMTSPVAAHALARGAHIFEVPLVRKLMVDKYKEDRGEKTKL
jgi:multicomponent Na+:H+ antiporter subunit G